MKKIKVVKQSLSDWSVVGADGKHIGWITREAPNRGLYYVRSRGEKVADAYPCLTFSEAKQFAQVLYEIDQKG